MPETEALNYIVRNYSKLSSKLTGTTNLLNFIKDILI